MTQKVFFYFPYMNEAGVPVLFLRMAKWLRSNYPDKYEISVIDYSDGAMARNIKPEDNLNIVCVSKTNDNAILFDDDSIVIMQTLEPSARWPKNLIFSKKTRLFFWTLHPYNLRLELLPLPYLFKLPYKYNSLYRLLTIFYRGYISKLAGFANSMYKHGALAFMDISTYEETIKYLPLNIKKYPDYLPVPADNYNGPLKKYSKKNLLHVCWLGRIEDEKLPSLVYIIQQVSKYATENQQRILFTPLGYGKDTEVVDNLNLENDFYSQEKCRPIKMVEINDYLIENIDLLFGMGTSALEAAKLGIPTCLVDASTEKIFKKDYVFKPVYLRTGCDLWHTVRDSDCEKDNTSLHDLFDGVINNFDEVSKKCRDYFVNNHAIDSVGRKFSQMIDGSSFTYDMIDQKVMEKPLLFRMQQKIHELKRRK